MNKDDIDKIVGEVTGYKFDLSKYGSLLDSKTNFLLATEYYNDGKYLWGMAGNGIVIYSGSGYSGIRAKVTLVEGVWRTASLQQCINL